MPTSDLANIAPIMRIVIPLKPLSVLDLGIGAGKYGGLCREYLDVRLGHMKREDWRVRIHGVEGFADYRVPAWDSYDEVRIEDFTRRYQTYRGYDLVLAIDSVEHVAKDVGIDMIATLTENNRMLIVSVPQGEWPQGAVHGNELERHRATWHAEDLRNLGGRIIQCGAEVACAIAVFDRSMSRAFAA